MSWVEFSQSKVIEPKSLEEKVETLRQAGKKIATLNGAFDLLHPGHLYMLYEAKKCGDVLIVALNTDRSIQGNKGELRPIVPLEQRIAMLTAIEFVNYVTWFDEADPRALLEIIRPDVHVNGCEYGENCLEAEVVKKHGGKIQLVDRIPSLSTTNIVDKILHSQNTCV